MINWSEYGQALGRAATCNRDHCTPEERAVLNSAIAMFEAENEADSGKNTINRTEALIRMQRAMKACRNAVDALLTARAGKEAG